MLYKVSGKKLSTSAVSRAKFELHLPNKYRGGIPTWSLEYWVKVVDVVGKQDRVNKNVIKKAKITKGCYQLRLGPTQVVRKRKRRGKLV